MDKKRRAKHFAPIIERLATAREKFTDGTADKISTVAEQIDAIGRGDFGATLRQASADVELEIFAPPEFPFIRRARGAAALRAAIQHNFDAIEDQQPVVSNVLAQGDVVVMFGTERGRIRATGTPYHIEFVHRFTFTGDGLQNIRIIAARAT